MASGTGTWDYFRSVAALGVDYGLAALAVDEFVVEHARVSGFAEVGAQ